MRNIYDSIVREKLDNAANFWFLNLLWLLFSIPIITIPPSLFALYYVLQQWIKGEGSGLIRDFWIGFKKYALRSYLYFFIFFLILLTNYFYYYLVTIGQDSIIISIGFGLSIIALITLLIINIYFMPLNMMLDTSFKKLLGLSLLFATKHIGTTILFLLEWFIVIYVIIYIPYIIIFGIIPLILYHQSKTIYEKLKKIYNYQ